MNSPKGIMNQNEAKHTNLYKPYQGITNQNEPKQSNFILKNYIMH